MTEAEWVASNDSWLMIHALRGKVSERKLRLFALECGRQVSTAGSLPVVQRLIDAVDRHLEHGATFEEVRALRNDVSHLRGRLSLWISDGYPEQIPVELSELPTLLGGKTIRREEAESVVRALQLIRWASTEAITVRLIQDFPASPVASAALMRCIFGNPFRPVALDSSWLTSTVTALARGIYDERAFDRLPILADALQDTGCDNADVLNHCRGDGPHARGCWVVDLLLGKA